MGAFAGALVAAVLGAYFTGAMDRFGDVVLSVPFVAAAFVGVGVLGLAYLVRQRWATATAGVLLVATVVGLIVSHRAGENARLVAAHLEIVCADGPWVAPPSCLPESEKYIVDNFSVFDPSTHHGWGELTDPVSVPIDQLSSRAAGLDGAALRSVGRVRYVQDFGGVLLIQLKQITTEQVDLMTSSLAHTLFDGDETLLAARAVEPGVDVPVAAYCIVTPRFFFTPHEGDLLAFNGVPVAVGQTGVVRNGYGTGETAQITYVQCSSVEHIE